MSVSRLKFWVVRLCIFAVGNLHMHVALADSKFLRHLQCVPYARAISHINLFGDAFLWWAEAAGRYARGITPVKGAVLAFRSISHMPLGHVAVVTGVINSRTVQVTQANWVGDTITSHVTVQDVSAENDWSQVQVEISDGQKGGNHYPTFGFIYNRPATGSGFNGSDLRGNEVAEASPDVAIAGNAPDRQLQ